jgi:hypothetical protein
MCIPGAIREYYKANPTMCFFAIMNNSQTVIEFTGRPATAYYGIISPAAYGKTTLTVTSNTVVERTKRAIATRYCEAPIGKIDSVEIVEDGNPLFLALGLTTLMFGIGIIFLVLYFVIKYKYLVVRSGNNVQIVMISSLGSGNMEQAKRFSATLMQSILRHNYAGQNPRSLSPAEQLARQQQAQRAAAQQQQFPG